MSILKHALYEISHADKTPSGQHVLLTRPEAMILWMEIQRLQQMEKQLIENRAYPFKPGQEGL